MALRFATNSIARFSSVVSMDWDNVTGKPDFSISEFNVAVGDGDGGFRGVAPGTSGNVLTSNGPSADPSFKEIPAISVFNVKTYGAVGDGATLDNTAVAAAVADAKAQNGGIVYFPAGGDYLINSTINLDNAKDVQLVGAGGQNSGGSTASTITYAGGASAISARDSVGIRIENLSVIASEAPRVLDFRGNAGSTSSVHVKSCFIAHNNAGTPSASRICIDVDNNENTLIEKTTFQNSACIGIQGPSGTGHYSINALIKDCVFPNMLANTIHIKAPGNSWVLQNCSFETPSSGTSIVKGTAGTSSQVTLLSCWFGDGGVKTAPLVTTNSMNFISIGSTYATSIGGGGSSTCVQMDNSSGGIHSIGDWIEADVGFAIGTGNTILIESPNQTHRPTTWYTGTPTNKQTLNLGGLVSIVGDADPYPSLNAKGLFFDSAASSVVGVGQGASNGLIALWNRSATPASATAAIATIGYSNSLAIDASAITIGTNNSAAVTINNGGAAPSGTGAYVRGTTPTLTTPVINGLSTGTGVATANTVSTLVARDGSGNFSAGTITAALSGNASTATTATNATNSAITNDTSTNATVYPTWVTANSGNLPIKVTSTKLVFNPSIGSIGLNTNTAPTTSLVAIFGGGSTLTGTTQLAMDFEPTFSSAATSAGYGFYVAPSTVAASFTMASMYGIRISNGTKGAGSTITTQYQLYIEDPTLGTNGRGLYSLAARNHISGSLSLGTDADGGAGGLTMTSGIQMYSGTAVPAGGTAGAGLKMSSTSNLGVFFGSGAPTLSAAKGSLYLRTDGSTTNDRMYVNTNGTTTWTAVTTVA